MIIQERMLVIFKRALKGFGDDPYMEKNYEFRIS